MPITLEYKMKKGQVYYYNVVMENNRRMKDEENDITENIVMRLKMIQQVKNVLPNGEYELEIEVEPQAFERDGSPMDVPLEKQVVKMKMDKYGNVTYSSVPTPQTSTTLPKEPVDIGKTWTGESKVNIPEINQEVKLLFTYTAESITNEKGYECLKIRVEGQPNTMEIEGIKQRFETSGYTLFAYKEGVLVKSEVLTKIHAEAGNATLDNNMKVLVELDKIEQTGAASTAIGGEEFLISG